MVSRLKAFLFQLKTLYFPLMACGFILLPHTPLNSGPYTYRFPKIDLPVGNDSHSGNAVPTTSRINDINDKILQNKTGIILFLVR